MSSYIQPSTLMSSYGQLWASSHVKPGPTARSASQVRPSLARSSYSQPGLARAQHGQATSSHDLAGYPAIPATSSQPHPGPAMETNFKTWTSSQVQPWLAWPAMSIMSIQVQPHPAMTLLAVQPHSVTVTSSQPDVAMACQIPPGPASSSKVQL